MNMLYCSKKIRIYIDTYYENKLEIPNVNEAYRTIMVFNKIVLIKCKSNFTVTIDSCTINYVLDQYNNTERDVRDIYK